jgi:hypothetical protein
MKLRRYLICCFVLFLSSGFSSRAAEAPDYVENHDTLYNNLTVEKRGTVVELRHPFPWTMSVVRLGD